MLPLMLKYISLKKKQPSITNLATTTPVTAVENKMCNVSNLVKKLTIAQKLVTLKIKLPLVMIMINILLLNSTAGNFAARLAQENLASVNYIANFVKETDFDDKFKNLNKNILLQIKMN